MHRRLCFGRVPIIVFHSVRPAGAPLEGARGELSLEASAFARGLAALQAGGCTSIRCAQLLDHLQHGTPLPPRPVLLTFDDGWRDNATTAAPLLRQHGFVATLFVATDLIEPDDAPGRGGAAGYCSAAELAALAREGTFELEAHSASHALLARRATPAGEELTWFGERGPDEAESTQRARIATDLRRCRERLAAITGRAPEFLAWPGGGVSPTGLDVALHEVGFRATFLTERWSAAVTPSPTALPRTFFSQHYRGRGADAARAQKLRGVVEWERGEWSGYVRLFLANRWMGWFR
ncbi:MAG: polysaccharide deacetylase family protein [Planctomycetes bacterium]|nr:polysaccharide deacetylase family protein [Planctomycetota bacterium]